MSSRLELYIPEQKETDAQSHLLQPKPLKAWIEGLPWANVGQVSKQVYKGLIEFNRSRVPRKECITIVELFRKPAAYVTRSLEKHFIDTGFPLSKRNRKIANLTHALNSELAIAYKIVIKQLLHASRLDKAEKKLLVVAIHHAIFYLSKVIIQSALIYEIVPSRVWHEIHSLFDYAERHDLEQISINDDGLGQEESQTTIADVYKQILLFSLASPSRLRQREIQQLYLLLRQWGQYAKLQQTPQKINLNNQFLILLDKDSPPIHLSLAKSHAVLPDDNQLILDTTELLSKVVEQPDAGQDGQLTTEMMSNRLLRRFIQPWSSAPQRKFVRTRLNFELNVAVGLKTIHSLLGVDDSLENEVADNLREDVDWLNQQRTNDGSMDGAPQDNRQTAAFTLTPIDQSLDVRRSDFEDFGPNSHSRREPKPVVPVWGRLNEPADSIVETYKFRTINESAGGYCLDWQGGEPPPIKVGELIGIQSTSISCQYGVAAIRWIQTQSGHGLRAGVEMLAPNVLPVEVGRNGEHQICLLLPETGNVEQKSSSLITPPHAFQSNADLMIDEKGGRRPIKLSRMLESTGAFSRYQFNYLDLPEEGGEDDAFSFDTIWSTL